MTQLTDKSRRADHGVGLRFRGTVVHGDARGRLLGFPTANLELGPGDRFPADGVWVARVQVPDRAAAEGAAGAPLVRLAALSVGTNPTYGGSELRVEAHLLDFDGDLYDREMAVEVLAHLRDTVRFDSEAALVQQIRADVEATRRWRG